jgi:hypothetical protein
MNLKVYVPQPAYKIYAFDRGWRVLTYVAHHLFVRTNKAARWWWDRADRVRIWAAPEHWFKKYWAWVIIVSFAIAGAAQYLSAFVLVALFVVIQAVLLTTWAALALLGMGILMGWNFLYSRYYRIFQRCPNCHNDMPIPIYICPTCHAEHTRLWPSIYGVLAHRCTCETKLPALSWLGRRRLQRICPHCRRPLNIGVGEGTNVHIPVVGGTSTGKTNYIVMATREFKNTYEQLYGYRISFTDPAHEHEFASNLQRLERGHELLATTEIVPQAYNLKIEVPGWRVPKLAYVYDAAGEAFAAYEHTSRQAYYKYIDGIIFVIDPFAIPEYYHTYQTDIEQIRTSLRPSKLGIMEAYERMTQMFEASVGVRKRKRHTQPVAVVVTKVDALNLEDEVGSTAAYDLMARDPSITSGAEAIHILVRDFLCKYDMDHFVRDLEANFAHVRYFSCSALGRLPSALDTSEFTPIRVLDPLIWLFQWAKVAKPVRQEQKKLAQPMPMTMKQRIR